MKRLPHSETHSLAAWSEADGLSLPGMSEAFKHQIYGSPGDDYIKGTSGNDFFYLNEGGNDRARGHDGNDVFYFENTLNSQDRVNGGEGRDVVKFGSNELVNLRSDHFTDVESFVVGAAKITIGDGFSNLVVNGRLGGQVSVDGASVTSGRLRLYGRPARIPLRADTWGIASMVARMVIY